MRTSCSRAQALVEFALTLPLLLLIVIGVVDAARAVWEGNTLAHAAREGARYAIVHGSRSTTPVAACSSCDAPAVTSVVAAAAIGVPGVTTVTGFPDGNNERGSRVKVLVTAPFAPMASQYLLGSAFSITLRGGSELVIQQ